MKLGLLADIHAKSEALSNVVEELRQLHIDTVIVAGDTVGYYYNILLVRELLSAFHVFEIKGNHENQILSNDRYGWAEYEKQYGSGLRRNKEDLKQEVIEHLRNLCHPLEINLDGHRIIVAQGTPWYIDEYLYQNSDKSSNYVVKSNCSKEAHHARVDVERVLNQNPKMALDLWRALCGVGHGRATTTIVRDKFYSPEP